MDHFYFLLLFGLVALVRWLFSEGGLRKILTNLEGDLNDKNGEPMRQQTSPTVRSQPMPRALGRVESEEEKRLRKFREALGLPEDRPLARPAPERRSIPQIPPIIHQPLPRPLARTRERAAQELKQLQRKTESRVAPPRLPPALQPVPVEDHGVERFFQMENFDRPSIQFAAPGANAPAPPAAVVEDRLAGIFGNEMDLRRMILAREILGLPKSLQIS